LLTAPWLTKAAPKLWDSLGVPGDLARAELPQALAWGGLPAAVRVTKAPALFPRLDAEGRIARRAG
ncbi:MAG TPA: methionine--tRNA ligase, partial [Actinomycetota bacterium]